MALSPPDLTDLFESPPTTGAECAAAWADAMGAAASGIVPPSTTVSAAQATLWTSLMSAFVDPVTAIPPMEAAFTAFATTVAAGMAPAFVATPPPLPVGFATLSAPVATRSIAASNFATLIDVWMRTGTATPSGGGSPVPWS